MGASQDTVSGGGAQCLSCRVEADVGLPAAAAARCRPTAGPRGRPGLPALKAVFKICCGSISPRSARGLGTEHKLPLTCRSLSHPWQQLASALLCPAPPRSLELKRSGSVRRCLSGGKGCSTGYLRNCAHAAGLLTHSLTCYIVTHLEKCDAIRRPALPAHRLSIGHGLRARYKRR